MINTRSIVLDMLIRILEEGKPSHIETAETLARYSELDRQNRSFIKRLCQGTVERKLTLDYIIDRLATVKCSKQKPVIRNILRMSIYQLIYMDSVPQSAACNEAVKLAGKRGFKSLGGFVNGILRNCIRRQEELLDFKRITDEGERISVSYSMPLWIIREWQKSYTNEEIIKTLDYFLDSNMTSIRCNISKMTPMELKKRLEAGKINVEEGRYLENCFRISGYERLSDIPEFRDGIFVVQDESSALSGAVTCFSKGNEVIDICAAPGGKTVNAADILCSLGGGNVCACDLSVSKTELIREAVTRCGFSNVRVTENDALVYNEAFEEKADVLIADLPCSGLGIIGKKPDIKYNMTPEKQKELVQLQRDILKNVVAYLKHGGTLLYSTCTINAEENERNVAFLEEELGLKRLDIASRLPEALGKSCKDGMLQLFPGIHGTDGFFIACLMKP